MLAVVLWALTGPPASDAAPPDKAPATAPASDGAAEADPPPPELPKQSMPAPEFVRDTRAPRRPSPKLQEVPFPLAESDFDAAKQGDPQAQSGGNLTIADLRDPFSRRASRKRKGAEMSALVIPDLRDPFRVQRVRRPKNWIAPQLPGDIRDPFSEEFRAEIRKRRKDRPACGFETTEDGVEIQRPDSVRGEPVPQPQCATLTPPDLRDPFDGERASK